MGLRVIFRGLAGLLLGVLPIHAQDADAGRLPLVWPTPNRAFLEGAAPEAFVQPTVSGRTESGLYGCVRNGGRRFHEGLDLKTIERDRYGRATDPVFAAMPGRVVHVNRVGGNSSFGIYVVLEHDHDGVRFYTLYSHLASVADGIAPGRAVEQGEALGIIGTTAAGYVIPRSRAHVHFEVGLQMTDDFGRWYDRQRFGSPNHHGDWNGMNLLGVDPLEFYQLSMAGRIDGLGDYLQRQPVALTALVPDSRTPDLLERSPALLEGSPSARRGGWEVDFNAYGVPLRFRPVAADALPPGIDGIRVTDFDPDLAFPPCRDLLRESGGKVLPGPDLIRTLELLFGS